MRMIITVILGLVILTPSYAFSFDVIAQKWKGTYSYNAFLGRTRGGDAIVYGVNVTISSTGICKVKEDGFQIMSRISCCISKCNNAVNINFKEYLPDNVVDFGYKKGDRLFSLSYTGKTLITTWGALEPDVKQKRGVFFKKVEK